MPGGEDRRRSVSRTPSLPRRRDLGARAGIGGARVGRPARRGRTLHPIARAVRILSAPSPSRPCVLDDRPALRGVVRGLVRSRRRRRAHRLASLGDRLAGAFATGYYVGESDVIGDPERARRSFAPDARARLVAVRRTYDSAGTFHSLA